ncbi:hypothetical protein SBA3_5220003 [Candidatus Sulfopaludibacter sp. SbA3]|nr:hypothetical protein SBA3_5220003 [Candidatus Sulfopaludibacter sp. SbA3]
MRQAIFGILLNRQMGKEGEILQDVSHATFGDGNVSARVRVVRIRIE